MKDFITAKERLQIAEEPKSYSLLLFVLIIVQIVGGV